MDFDLTEDQATIRDAVRELAGKFDEQYWVEKDGAHEFPPTEFYDAFAKGGWLGITTPEAYGGHGMASPRLDPAGGSRRVRCGHERREFDAPVDLRDAPGDRARL